MCLIFQISVLYLRISLSDDVLRLLCTLYTNICTFHYLEKHACCFCVQNMQILQRINKCNVCKKQQQKNITFTKVISELVLPYLLTWVKELNQHFYFLPEYFKSTHAFTKVQSANTFATSEVWQASMGILTKSLWKLPSVQCAKPKSWHEKHI